MFSARTASRWHSASTSTCRTPGTIAATSELIRRTARHGWQNAVENCNNVASAARSTPSASNNSGAMTSPPGPVADAASGSLAAEGSPGADEATAAAGAFEAGAAEASDAGADGTADA
ncbi:hypothetical protein Acsp02_06270 [Actinoplanes sp. NBRC 103695]|nr:hypothetical protein Acsp02_06270 [Actinoplanes sp. NBRC 103695]